MNFFTGGCHSLNEAELKQYAFCQGGFNQFYDERGVIGGGYFAYCHVLGELTLRMTRIPTMTFLSQVRRDAFRQQLGELGRQAMRDVKIEEGVSRQQCRQIVDMAVADFSGKGRARDVQFAERSNPRPPNSIEVRHIQQAHQHE